MSLKKLLLVVLALALLGGAGMLFYFVATLPSRHEVAGIVRDVSAPAGPAYVKPTQVPPATQAKPGATAPLSDAKAREKDANEQGFKMILALVDEDPRDVRVCENLGHSKIDFSKAEPDTQLDRILGEDRTDSWGEAYRMPLRAMFHEPSVASLMKELQAMDPQIRDSSQAEKESLFDKIGFYARVGKAAADLYSNREHYENLGNRATHLGVIARIALLKPEARNNARLMDICRLFEDTSHPIDHATLVEERKVLLALVEELGMKPQDVGLEPDSWIKFSVKADRKGFNFSLTGSKGTN